jgi:hypothetical protein
MNIDNTLKPIDNFISKINENKTILLLILIILGVYYTNYIQGVSEHLIDLFSNDLFKFAIFVLISYISSSSPALGISLAIIMLVTLQIITNLKLQKDTESFGQMEPLDNNYMNNEYLNNPYLKINELEPTTNFNLKLETPNDIANQMIKRGKILLSDSYDLEKDLEKRFDVREKKIAETTKHNGLTLIESGLNRLQMANQGEYEVEPKTKGFGFIRYNKLVNKDIPEIMTIYNQLIKNYEVLTSQKLDKEEFDRQLNKVYQNELELIETIYKYKKEEIPPEIIKTIDTEINKIKGLRNNNKQWLEQLEVIRKLIC